MRLAIALAALAAVSAQRPGPPPPNNNNGGGIVLQPTNGAFQAQFNGQSGSFKLFMNNNSSRTFWNINYRNLIELDTLGNQVNSIAFSPQATTLTSGQGVANDGSLYSYVDTTSTQVVGSGPSAFPVTFIARNAVFVTSTTMNVLNKTSGMNISIPVTQNSLKISMNISGWMPASAANTLSLRVKISSNMDRDAAQPSGSLPPPGPGMPRRSGMQLNTDGAVSAQMLWEDSVYVGDAMTLMPVTFGTANGNNGNNGNVITINFPASSALWYDPEVLAVGNGVGALGMSAFAAILAAVMAVFTLKQ